FVIESGDSGAPALVLLHGSMANSFTWFSDVPALSEHYHVFAVDLIGEAGFSAETRPSYQSGAYQKWLDEVLHGLNITTCTMVGLSLGGWMALRYATVYPQRIEKLVLLCPGGLFRERRDFLWKSLLMKLTKGGVHKTMRGVMGDTQAQADGMEQVLAYVALIGRQEKPRMAKLALFTDKELSRLTMPVYVLFGDSDIILRAQESIARIMKLAPNVHSEILPNTGHAVVGQAQRILQFLNG
ncbi:MAG: alpha/beta hydrolase, partial [Clostridia bacterium]|nr:alpha/beta hydrolase [Clostridia bacterium]